MGTGRLEAFSDGVLAVAITLLVLDLHVDYQSPETLLNQLGHEWPSFLGYVISFFVLGIIWVNHHALLGFTQEVDRTLLFFNLTLLLWATTIPFTTAALASYMRQGGENAHVAVLMYGASAEGMSVSFTAMLHHVLHRQLSIRPVSSGERRLRVARFGLGIVLYPVATAFGFLSAPAMLVSIAVIGCFYIFEQTPDVGMRGPRGRSAASASDRPPAQNPTRDSAFTIDHVTRGSDDVQST